MRVGLTAEEHLELNIEAPLRRLHPADFFKKHPGELADARKRARGLAENTEGVVSELRRRGYDADSQHVQYLLRAGSVPAPKRVQGSGALAWDRLTVEILADVLEAEQRFTASAAACAGLMVSYADYLRALEKARAENPDLGANPDPTAFRLTVEPYDAKTGRRAVSMERVK